MFAKAVCKRGVKVIDSVKVKHKAKVKPMAKIKRARVKDAVSLEDAAKIFWDGLDYEDKLIRFNDWAYENEWRLIQKEEPGYLTYDSDELVGVLLGHKLEEDRAEQIIQSCRSHGIPYLKTKPAPRFSKIKFIPCCSRNDFKGCVWDAIDRAVRESATLSEETIDLYRKMNF